MLKYARYISKFVSDILPSVVATIIGAYIVNHYIVTKPDAQPAAAVARTADPAAAPALKAEAKPGDTPAEAAPVKARTVVDKSSAEKSVADKPAPEKTAEKTTSHTPLRDRASARSAAPVTTGSVPTAAPAESPDERRDANELARAAIERLRPATARPVEAAPRAVEAAPRVQEAARTQEPVRAVVPIQPLPPAVTVAMPASVNAASAEGNGTSPMPPSPPATYSVNGSGADPRRPSPPAEIPPPTFMVQTDPVPAARRTVAEDVLLAAQSVFHAVLPR